MRILKLGVLALLLALVIVMQVACSQDNEETAQTPTIDVTQDAKPFKVSRETSLVLLDGGPITLDPALVREVASGSYALEIFSGLVTLDKDLKTVPDIAEGYVLSEDGMTYTFQLRRDVKFHDGRPVTAEDFKYSFERACDPETESLTAASYLNDVVGVRERLADEASEISGITVVDDYTIRITIDSPKAYFLAKLVHPVAFVVDRENVESGEGWWRKPNGTGPFRLLEWKIDERLVLERNDLYYGQMPHLEHVVFEMWTGIPMVLYENGEIDITSVYSVDIERVLDPGNPLNNDLVMTPEFSIFYLGFNINNPPFDDVKVRQAFCRALDKDAIVEMLLKGMVERADGILPPGMAGYNEDIRGLDFDPEKARGLIAESRYGDVSELPKITFTTAGLGEVSSLLEAMIVMWRQNLGVEVQVRQLDPATFPYVIDEEKDELFDLGWVADFPDPQNFLDILFHSASEDNTGDYSNPNVDALLEAARGESDEETRLDLYRQAEQLIVDDAGCWPMFFNVKYTLVKPYVKGFTAAPMPIPWLKYVYIDYTPEYET